MISLRNLGPKSQAMLASAGIETVEELRAMGSVHAYLAVKRSGAKPSLNLLWALEAALQDCHWQEIVRDQRLSLLMQLEDLERGRGDAG